MKFATSERLKVLVLDVGGTHVKCAATDHGKPVEFVSGPKMTPEVMGRNVLESTRTWRFDVVSMGYPGVVSRGVIVREPHNLGRGWVGFDFHAAFDRPVKIVNDAAMQALGSYEGGKMLFLGLGTGPGSALIVDGVVVAMELAHLHCGKRRTYEDHVGEAARERLGNEKWRRQVHDVVEGLRKALLPDVVVLGGGNATRLKRLPPGSRRGDNAGAIVGGLRQWDEADA